MNLSGSVALITLFCWLTTGLDITVSFPQSKTSLNSLTRSKGVGEALDLLSEKEAIFVATNQERARKHVAVLKQDAKLMQAAQQYAELMAAKDQMSHTLNGLNLTDKAKRVGYSFRQLSENIALNTRLDGRYVVVDQWMESKGHRKKFAG